MNKPSEQQIKDARAVLKSAGYAVDSLWSIEDVNKAINESDDPAKYSGCSDKDKLEFLDSVVSESLEGVNQAIEDSLMFLID